MDEQDGAARQRRFHGKGAAAVSLGRTAAGRRRSLTVLVAVVAFALVSAGSGLTGVLARSARHGERAGPAAGCLAPNATPAPVAEDHLGGWGFDLVEPGTFGAVVSSSSALYALQACGAEETQLRVLEIGRNGNIVVSAFFERAALLTSSLTLAGGSLYVGTARLDLAGPLSSPPYLLTVYRLDASTLQVMGSRAIGRGFGLWLDATADGGRGATVLASTGRSLLSFRAGSLTPRWLASFGSSVAQHLAVGTASPLVAVSLSAPSVAASEAGARIELFDVATGRMASSLRLGGGAVVESMALGSGGLFVAVSSGLASTVRLLPLPLPGAGRPNPAAATGMPAALGSITLDASGPTVWAIDESGLACLDPSTGRLLAITALSSPLQGVIVLGAASDAVTGSGIGVLASPPACRAA